MAQCPLPGLLPSRELKEGQIKNLKTSIQKEWNGGFIGRIEIEIPRDITEWSIKLEFRRKIYRIACDYASVRKIKQKQGKEYILSSTPVTGNMQRGDTLEFFFLGDTFKEVKGFTAKMTFNWVWDSSDRPCELF